MGREVAAPCGRFPGPPPGGGAKPRLGDPLRTAAPHRSWSAPVERVVSLRLPAEPLRAAMPTPSESAERRRKPGWPQAPLETHDTRRSRPRWCSSRDRLHESSITHTARLPVSVHALALPRWPRPSLLAPALPRRPHPSVAAPPLRAASVLRAGPTHLTCPDLRGASILHAAPALRGALTLLVAPAPEMPSPTESPSHPEAPPPSEPLPLTGPVRPWAGPRTSSRRGREAGVNVDPGRDWR